MCQPIDKDARIVELEAAIKMALDDASLHLREYRPHVYQRLQRVYYSPLRLARAN